MALSSPRLFAAAGLRPALTCTYQIVHKGRKRKIGAERHDRPAASPAAQRPLLLRADRHRHPGLSRTPGDAYAGGAAQGVGCVYRLIDLTELGLGAEALPELLLAAERMGFDGLNITHPCKQAVVPLLSELSPEAGRWAR